MRIGSSYTFAAAHSLPRVHAGHKCARVHGHNWRVAVEILGACTDKGWIMDKADLDTIVKRELVLVDHHNLNEIDGLSNPTVENVVHWFAARLRNALKDHAKLTGGSAELVFLKVWETDDFWATWSTSVG